jgi:nitroimidazol reductase NimA-like FMN-containing flavoprotein (pyridoxamine 5'-phosphate oxidase superfamily)
MHTKKIWADEEALHDFLLHGMIGHLTTIDPGGWPHTVPVDYIWHDLAVFFHSGPGAKMDHIRQNPKVAFSVTESLGLVTSDITADKNPCRDTHLGRSVLIRGLAREILDQQEKMEVLNILITKYDPKAVHLGTNPSGSTATAESPGFLACQVVKIEVAELTGRRLLLLDKPEEYRAALAEHFRARGLINGSHQDLKTYLLLR